MIAAPDIQVERSSNSKLPGVVLENIPFGRVFTDHMLEADFEGGEWKNVRIKPYGPIEVDPANAAWHYGQSIFEGIKAYPLPGGEVAIFRPYDNLRRFNISARRMKMPEVPEEIFIEGMRQLIAVDKDWMPHFPNHALYIRPFMFASDNAIGVRPSENYKFMVILSPSGPYYPAPMRIYVEEQYVRAVKGGVGYAKTAGNYAAAMLATAEAQAQGYDQVLWTDAFEHRYVQEIGTMNVFFVLDGTVVTPDLKEGTILAGVTRDSVITVLREAGVVVEERPIAIEELLTAYKAGQLTEAFGSGTAATISTIKELRYKEEVMHFDPASLRMTPMVLERLNAIRYGHVPDVYGWLVRV
jgi:branched-chain amino acid aminotransferase